MHILRNPRLEFLFGSTEFTSHSENKLVNLFEFEFAVRVHIPLINLFFHLFSQEYRYGSVIRLSSHWINVGTIYSLAGTFIHVCTLMLRTTKGVRNLNLQGPVVRRPICA